MKKIWSKQFFACCMSLVCILASFLLSFTILFSIKAKQVTAQAESSKELVGKSTPSSTIYGYIPFNFSGFSDKIVESTDGNTNYLSYILKNEDTLTYEHDLALCWREQNTQTAGQGIEKYLEFTFKLQDINFTSIKLTLESAASNASKAGKVSTTIELKADGTVQVVGATTAVTDKLDYTKDITFKLSKVNNKSNAFAMSFENNSKSISLGEFTSVYGMYTSYRSNKDTTIIPLKLECIASGEQTSKLLIKKLNGQNFTVNSGHTIVDDALPVIVPNRQIFNFVNGTSFSSTFDYRVIDVMSATLSTKDYLGADVANESLADFKKKEENKVESRSDAKLIDTTATAVRAVVTLIDRKTNAQGETVEEETDIELKWYTDNNSIKLVAPEESKALYPTMQWTTTNNPNTTTFIQESIKATGYTENNGKISMPFGSGAYLYFGDLTSIVKSDLSQDTNNPWKVDPRDIQYTIYYKVDNSDEVQTGGTYYNNELRLEINPTNGIPVKYQIVIVPQYSKTENFTMQVAGQTVDASNVFTLAKDSNNQAQLAILEFNLEYNGPEVKNATTSQAGYVGSIYSGIDIQVVGLNNGAAYMQAEYTLYELIAENKANLAKDVLLAEMENLRNGTTSKIAVDEATYNQNKEQYIGYLKEIREGDKGYDWKPENKTFIPQAERFYIVQARVTSSYGAKAEQYGFQVVDVLSRADINAGHDPSWVQKNLASIILFSISGALLIVLIVLIFLPDKNKQRTKKLIGANKNTKVSIEATKTTTESTTAKTDILEKYKHLLKKK